MSSSEIRRVLLAELMPHLSEHERAQLLATLERLAQQVPDEQGRFRWAVDADGQIALLSPDSASPRLDTAQRTQVALALLSGGLLELCAETQIFLLVMHPSAKDLYVGLRAEWRAQLRLRRRGEALQQKAQLRDALRPHLAHHRAIGSQCGTALLQRHECSQHLDAPGALQHARTGGVVPLQRRTVVRRFGQRHQPAALQQLARLTAHGRRETAQSGAGVGRASLRCGLPQVRRRNRGFLVVVDETRQISSIDCDGGRR